MNNLKFYSVTRRDLPIWDQSVQSSHALIDFIFTYPEQSNKWHLSSNYLGKLSVENETELNRLAIEAEFAGIKVKRFYEPDMKNRLTAIALEASPAATHLVSRLPKMFEEYKTLEAIH